MRYAAAPVGQLRFAAPREPDWSDDGVVLEANQQGPICLPTPGNTNTTLPASEDCLFLSVYAPTKATQSSKLPVFIYIQGGGFNVDSNANYNGSGLIMASDFEIVVVTFNYRVGPYGFLASREILQGGSVNNGLKDQRMVMEWVSKYILKFGGDPAHVVLGGSSAGAASVTLHLTAYGGRNDNLFHGTAAESQSFGTVFTVSETQYQYDGLVARANCSTGSNNGTITTTDTLSCLRSLPAEVLQRVNINVPSPGAQGAPLYMYSPVLDGDLIQDYTYSAYAKGNYIHLPAIYGDDQNEGTVFVPRNTSSVNDTDVFIKNQWPSISQAGLDRINQMYLYPLDLNETYPGAGVYWRQASNAYGEIRYNCPGIFCAASYTSIPSSYASSSDTRTAWRAKPRNLAPRAKLLQRDNSTASGYSSDVPIWLYRYNVLDPTQSTEGYGVPHTVELNAIFGPEYVGGAAPSSYNSTNAWIVPIIQGYWTRFVRFLDPNAQLDKEGVLPYWERFVWGEGDDGYKGESLARRLRFGDVYGGVGVDMEDVPQDQKDRCGYLWGIAEGLRQ